MTNRFVIMELREDLLAGKVSEDRALELLKELKDDLRIITNEPSGQCDDVYCPRSCRCEPAEDIEVHERARLWEDEEGGLHKERVKSVRVSGPSYTAPDGRLTRDWTSGAPTAVLARLLEVAELRPLEE